MKRNQNLVTLLLAASLLGAPCALRATPPPGWPAKAAGPARPELVHAVVLEGDPDNLHLIGRNFGPFEQELGVSINGMPLPQAWFTLENANHIVISCQPEALGQLGDEHEFVVSVRGRSSAILRSDVGIRVASPAMLLGPEAGDPGMRESNAVVRLAFNLPQWPWNGNAGSLSGRPAPQAASALALPEAPEDEDDEMDVEDAEALEDGDAGLCGEDAESLDDGDEGAGGEDVEAEADDPSGETHAAAAPFGNMVMTRRVCLSHAKLSVLQNWFRALVDNPYPNAKQKSELMAETGASLKQVVNWFTNTRKRFWYRHPTDPTKNELRDERVPGSESTPRPSATPKDGAKAERSRPVWSALPAVVEAKQPFTKAARAVLRQWALDHLRDPYPSDDDKRSLMQKTKLNYSQVSAFFINFRMRAWGKACAAQGLVLHRSSAAGASYAEPVTSAQPGVIAGQPKPAPALKRSLPKAARLVSAASAAPKPKQEDSDSDYAPSDSDAANEPKHGRNSKRSKQ